jgi:hypothetical protein
MSVDNSCFSQRYCGLKKNTINAKEVMVANLFLSKNCIHHCPFTTGQNQRMINLSCVWNYGLCTKTNSDQGKHTPFSTPPREKNPASYPFK